MVGCPTRMLKIRERGNVGSAVFESRNAEQFGTEFAIMRHFRFLRNYINERERNSLTLAVKTAGRFRNTDGVNGVKIKEAPGKINPTDTCARERNAFAYLIVVCLCFHCRVLNFIPRVLFSFIANNVVFLGVLFFGYIFFYHYPPARERTSCLLYSTMRVRVKGIC